MYAESGGQLFLYPQRFILVGDKTYNASQSLCWHRTRTQPKLKRQLSTAWADPDGGHRGNVPPPNQLPAEVVESGGFVSLASYRWQNALKHIV